MPPQEVPVRERRTHLRAASRCSSPGLVQLLHETSAAPKLLLTYAVARAGRYAQGLPTARQNAVMVRDPHAGLAPLQPPPASAHRG